MRGYKVVLILLHLYMFYKSKCDIIRIRQFNTLRSTHRFGSGEM